MSRSTTILSKSIAGFEVKSVNEDKREIRGWASTPTPDRVNDVIDPMGLTSKGSIPLLLDHKHDQPVGNVEFGQPTPKGFPFTAKIAKVDEPGEVKTRTDTAWHSVKHGLIKHVSIGFFPKESKPLSNGGIHFTKADVHELSLTAVPANPEATITGIKAVVVDPAVPEWLARSGMSKEVIAKYMQLNADDLKHTAVPLVKPIVVQTPVAKAAPKTNIQSTVNKDNTMNTNANHFIRAAIAKTIAGTNSEAFAANRWGADSDTARYIKAAVNPITAGTDASGALTVGTISRQQFVQAVFSRSILGQLQGLVRVPAITRINTEATPLAGAFYGEGTYAPVAQGAIGVYLTDKRKVGILSVISSELLQMTDETAETTISGTLQRALSRGLDNAFVGSQIRGDTSPAGLASVATQIPAVTAMVGNVSTVDVPATFAAGVAAFTGDPTMASVLVNPLTAMTLRSPTETQITARGGVYGGLLAVTSEAVPVGALFIVDASRVLAFIGDATVTPFRDGSVAGLGATPTVPVNLFQTSQVALLGEQYADWQFAPGAAVQVTLAA